MCMYVYIYIIIIIIIIIITIIITIITIIIYYYYYYITHTHGVHTHVCIWNFWMYHLGSQPRPRKISCQESGLPHNPPEMRFFFWDEPCNLYPKRSQARG